MGSQFYAGFFKLSDKVSAGAAFVISPHFSCKRVPFIYLYDVMPRKKKSESSRIAQLCNFTLMGLFSWDLN